MKKIYKSPKINVDIVKIEDVMMASNNIRIEETADWSGDDFLETGAK